MRIRIIVTMGNTYTVSHCCFFFFFHLTIAIFVRLFVPEGNVLYHAQFRIPRLIGRFDFDW